MTSLDATERATLLALARQAIEARVRDGDAPRVEGHEGSLAQPGAAFVSVHVGGKLRGCLGCIEPRGTSLAVTVADLAAAAATSDPRFAPLNVSDLAHLSVEISVLSPLIPVAAPGDVVIGRDGLVVGQGLQRGLLLPQVATRLNWTVRQFLEETCRKAGLLASAWAHGAAVYRFEADVFAETPSPEERPVS